MKIGYCRACAMEKDPEENQPSRRRITVQIIVDIIIWFSVSLIVLYLFLHGKPFQTGFFCDDPSLSYPSKDSSVSTHILLAAGFAVSFLLVVLIEVLNCFDEKCRRSCQPAEDFKYCVKNYIVFMIGFLVEEMIVEVVKNKMGTLRPNFFDVCKPQFNRTLCPGYISEYICTRNENEKDLRNSRQSFPSGHSAFSMYIAIYFSIYAENRLRVRFSRLLKIFLQSGLVLIAVVCGIGRIKDHKHHPSDVIAGFILGIIVAVFVYNMLGRKLLKSTSEINTASLHIVKQQCECCCTYEQSEDLELQTPAPLLQNEYTPVVENGQDSSSIRRSSLQNNNCSDLIVKRTSV